MGKPIILAVSYNFGESLLGIEILTLFNLCFSQAATYNFGESLLGIEIDKSLFL